MHRIALFLVFLVGPFTNINQHLLSPFLIHGLTKYSRKLKKTPKLGQALFFGGQNCAVQGLSLAGLKSIEHHLIQNGGLTQVGYCGISCVLLFKGKSMWPFSCKGFICLYLST